MQGNACPEEHALLRKRANDYIEAGHFDSAYQCSMQFYESAKALNDSGCIVKAHIFLWHTATKLGRMEEALAHLQQAHIENCASSHPDSVVLSNSLSCIQNLSAQLQNETGEEDRGSAFLTLLLPALLLLLVPFGWMAYRKHSKHQADDLSAVTLSADPSALSIVPEPASVPVQSTATQCASWKLNELVARLEQLMNEQHLYREKLLTRDKVAELLDTNRTYLGQVMSEYYKKSFTQYINDLRINEAIRILDDPSCKRPIRMIGLDLGFNSVTTFNAQFQNRTGMTPAQYRQQKVEKV